MGAKTSKRYTSLKSLLNPFKLFLVFLPNGPHKTTFGIFEKKSSKLLEFTIVSYAETKNLNYWKIRREKLSKM